MPATLTPDVLADVATTDVATTLPTETTASLDTTPQSSTTDNAVVAATVPSSTTAEPTSLEGVGTIGQVADGNRVLVIGDSLMASTSVRYGGAMCERLVPLGWSVDVEAETSQQVNFGLEVLDEPSRRGLGCRRGDARQQLLTDQLTFESELTEIVERLAPRPILLLTVTEFDRHGYRSTTASAGSRPSTRTSASPTGRTSPTSTTGCSPDDGLHLSEVGSGATRRRCRREPRPCPAGKHRRVPDVELHRRQSLTF